LDRRSSGILLHPTSLPSRYGIGDLGPEARRFVDWLADAGQSIWQVLPIGPTGFGDSPYQALSAFAGNPLLISAERLVKMGLLDRQAIGKPPRFPRSVAYGRVIAYKTALLQAAYAAFVDSPRHLRDEFENFRVQNAGWLADYSLYRALKDAHGGAAWFEWPDPVKRRDEAALEAARRDLKEVIQTHEFAQFLFSTQWAALRQYAHERGVTIVGDVPIFVARDSCDVWARRELFLLDRDLVPTHVAGVPPDYFSRSGQLWGNPLYEWSRHTGDGFGWWIARLRINLERFDYVRLDHFRGFAAAWHVPYGAATAARGAWVPGPGARLFRALLAKLGALPVIAEDLGVITPDVEALRDSFGLPGMRVLQFAFDGFNKSDGLHLPHNHVPHTLVYTGTHDNDTTVGWFSSLRGKKLRVRRQILDYLGTDGSEINWSFIRLAMASVARMSIVPMQDVLGLGSQARMNEPARPSGNWRWRLASGDLTKPLARKLLRLVSVFGRVPSGN
jgi:4-alpha-glucanotransferase